MLRRVSVQSGLTDVKAQLEDRGYTVFEMAECHHPVQAVIYSGENLPENQLSERWAKSTLLINANGMNGEQVAQRLNEKI